MAGEKDDGPRAPRLRQPGLQIHSSQVGHGNVEQGASRERVVMRLQECLSRLKAQNLEIPGRQQARKRSNHARVVIDKKYLAGRRTHRPAPAVNGKATRKVAPRSGLLAAERRPPCARMMDRQTE